MREFAPAKLNLFLHVGPIEGGYHPIASLMTFADLGDEIEISRDDEMSFAIEGPFGEGLAAEPDNLVLRARDAFLAAALETPPPFRLTLTKRLPVASGLGGGSSDAAATLRLLNQSLGGLVTEGDLAAIAEGLGSDVPACLRAAPVLASGRGEVLDAPFVFPAFDAVLINPGVAVSTGRVFGAYDAGRTDQQADMPGEPEPLWTTRAAAAFLATCRNDLEAPAVGLCPEIGKVLADLQAQPETLLARMSGSGATCFALCDSPEDARDLALRLGSWRVNWWVRQCRLQGFGP